MQIGKADNSGIVAATRTSPAAQADTTPAAAANPPSGAAVSPPLTGGRRTLSPGIFTEAENEEAADLTPTSLAQLVAQKTKDFSKVLTTALEAAKIPTGEPLTLRIDGAGRVTADGPYKERVEKLFKERPELEQQFKDVAALNSLVALNEAMRRFAQAKKDARDDDERSLAEATYLSDCLEVQARSDMMVLDGGQLASPAVAYMATR